MRFKTLFCCLALLAAASVASAADNQPKFASKCKKAEDQVTPSLVKDGVAFRVTSKSGIGAAEISLSEGDWPTNITLQMELGSLESFQVDNGKVSLSGHLMRDRPKTVWTYDQDGQPVQDQKKAVYTLMMVQQKERLIEVQLPANFGTKDKTLRISWIDAFRQ